MLRIAGNFHLVLNPDKDEIQPECVLRAERLVDWYMQEVLSYSSNILGQSSKEALLKDYLLGYYEKTQSKIVRKSYILQNGPRDLRNKRDLHTALSELEKQGYVYCAEVDRQQWVALNPHWLDSGAADIGSEKEINSSNTQAG